MRAWKICTTEQVHNKMDLYRMIYSIFGSQMFTVNSMHDILSTGIFPDFNPADIWSNNYDKINICRARLISTGSYKMFFFLNILLEPNPSVINFQ